MTWQALLEGLTREEIASEMTGAMFQRKISLREAFCFDEQDIAANRRDELSSRMKHSRDITRFGEDLASRRVKKVTSKIAVRIVPSKVGDSGLNTQFVIDFGAEGSMTSPAAKLAIYSTCIVLCKFC